MGTTKPSLESTRILTTKALAGSINIMQTTASTKMDNGKNEKDYSWLRYIAIFGVAAAVLIICIVIAIVRSRFKSIRKAKDQYERDQMRAKQEIEKQKQATLSRMSTTISSSDPFFIHDTIVEVSPPVNNIATLGQEDPGAARRSSYVQPIPSFLQAIHQPTTGSITRDVTPPPRLSPIFQISEERLHEEQVPPRRNTDFLLLPHQKPGKSNSPPVLLPREPIPSQRRPRYYSHGSNPYPSAKLSVTHGSQNACELSMIIQGPEERLSENGAHPRSHSASSYHCKGPNDPKDSDCPPELPPRGPLFSSRRPQIDLKTKERSYSQMEGQDQNFGFITDEVEAAEADKNSDNA